MDFGYAFTYIFDDSRWLSKITPLGLLMLVAVVPILGLPALALALGYMLQIAVNVRNGLAHPLPKWQNLSELFTTGGQVLLALVLYNLPLAVLSSCIAWTLTGIGSGFLGDTLNFTVVCCLAPLVVLYVLLVWALLAIGLTEYIDTGEFAALYRFVHLIDVFRANGRVVREWVLYMLLLNAVLVLLLAIPCIGWFLFILIAQTTHGHLLGQFALKLGASNRAAPRKRKV